MGLFALVLIFMKRYFQDKKAVFLPVGFVSLGISMMCWSAVFLFGSEVNQARMTVGGFISADNYLSQGGAFFLPLGVYCLLKAFWRRPKIFGIFISVGIPIAVSFTLGFVSSLIRTAALNSIFDRSYSGFVGLELVYIGLMALVGIVSGFFAVSWIEYIHVNRKERIAPEEQTGSAQTLS